MGCPHGGTLECLRQSSSPLRPRTCDGGSEAGDTQWAKPNTTICSSRRSSAGAACSGTVSAGGPQALLSPGRGLVAACEQGSTSAPHQVAEKTTRPGLPRPSSPWAAGFLHAIHFTPSSSSGAGAAHISFPKWGWRPGVKDLRGTRAFSPSLRHYWLLGFEVLSPIQVPGDQGGILPYPLVTGLRWRGLFAAPGETGFDPLCP